MGYWLNESAILNPNRVREAMYDLAKSGFGIVRIMLRNTNFTHRSPRVVAAVSVAVKAAHEQGMRVALDCEPHAAPVAGDMGREFPEAMGSYLYRAQASIVNGTFKLRINSPVAEAQMPVFSGIEAAFLKIEDRLTRLEPFPYDLRWEVEMHKDGFCRAEQDYLPGIINGRRHCMVSGHLDAPGGSELIAYLKISDSLLVDFWSDGFRRYFESLLECYRDIPLDGFGWDEPAVAGEWDCYRYGTAFAEAFERINGYQLADRLWLLDECGMNANSARVRLDYYQTLNEGVFQAQNHFITKACELFGNDLLLGTHHTWRGEGSNHDYRAGAVDYFRLNDNMDAGYTDCCWWDMGSVYYAYVLASSLGRLTSSGEAECNTWHWKPTNTQAQYHARLMSLMDVTWFNIWYGDNADTCQYPAHYTWAKTLTSMRQHRADQLLIGAARPVVEIAIWHGWEGVCALNRADVASAHKAFYINTSEALCERNIPFDFIDSRLLENSAVEGDELVTALGRYRIVVLPYAMILSRAAWGKCVAFASAGGKLTFIGPVPEMDATGVPLRNEFSELLEMPPLSLADYLTGIDAACTLPKDRPPTIDMTYPLAGDAKRIIISDEEEPHAIRSPQGNVIYMTDLDPRERLVRCLETLISPEVCCLSDSIQWRLYRDAERSVLVCIARKDRQMSGLVCFGGHQIEIKRGTVAVIEFIGCEFKVHGTDVEWDIRPSDQISDMQKQFVQMNSKVSIKKRNAAVSIS